MDHLVFDVSVVRHALIPVDHVKPLFPTIGRWQVSEWIVWPDSNRALVARIKVNESGGCVE